MFIEIDKENPIHHALILAKPIKAAGNVASAKVDRLLAMYKIHSPVVKGRALFLSP